jgi:hypothetical protein
VDSEVCSCGVVSIGVCEGEDICTGIKKKIKNLKKKSLLF